MSHISHLSLFFLAAFHCTFVRPFFALLCHTCEHRQHDIDERVADEQRAQQHVAACPQRQDGLGVLDLLCVCAGGDDYVEVLDFKQA